MEVDRPLLVENVSKQYGFRPVLSDIAFALESGEVCLVLGANGVGKSTLLKICAGILRPDKGRVLTRQGSIGYSTHETMLYQSLTVEENFNLICNLAKSSQDPKAILSEWNLLKYSDQEVRTLSKGNKARLSLARAFLNNPKVVLLDEPSSALDDSGVKILLSCIQRSKQAGACVLMASHDMARLLPLATRAIILKEQKIFRDISKSSAEQILAGYLEVNT